MTRSLVPAPPRKHVLGNGLRILVDTVPGEPLTAVAVHYGAGFRSEPRGRAGLAHLVEHMMFEGSERHPDRAYFADLLASGGSATGTTHQDYTDYVHVVPAHALEDALVAEADRMRAPLFTTRGFAEQLAGVEAEIRAAVYGARLGGLPWQVLPGVLYDRWANSHDGYGALETLAELTPDDCAGFFRDHYTPANAVVTVSGGGEPDHVAGLVARHFGEIPVRSAPAARPVLTEPPLAEDRVAVRPTATRDGALSLGYRLPDPAADLDGYLAHLVLARLLTAPPRNAGCGFFRPFDAVDPDTLVVGLAMPADGMAAALSGFDAALRGIADGAYGEEAVRRTTGRLAAEHIRDHHGPAARAAALGRLELLFGRAVLVDELPGRIRAVGAERVGAAAARLLTAHRAVLAAVPVRAAAGPQGQPAGSPREAEPMETGPAESGLRPAGPAAVDPAPAEGHVDTDRAQAEGRTDNRTETEGRTDSERAAAGEPVTADRPVARSDDAATRGRPPAEACAASGGDRACSDGPSAAPPHPAGTRRRPRRAGLRLPGLVESGGPGEARVVAVRDSRAPVVEFRLRLPTPPGTPPARQEHLCQVVADRWDAQWGRRTTTGGRTVRTEAGTVVVDAWFPAPGPDPVLLAGLLAAAPTAAEWERAAPRARARVAACAGDPWWLADQAVRQRLALGAAAHAGAVTVVAVGDLDPERWVQAATGALRPLTIRLPDRTEESAPAEGLALLRLPPAQQTPAVAHVVWATPEPPRAVPLAARWLATAVVGGGQPGARLTGLRTPGAPHGFTAYAGRFPGLGPGDGALVQVGAQLPPQDAVLGAGLVRDALRRIGEAPPVGADVDAARRYCAGQLALVRGTQSELADQVGAWVATGARAAELDGFTDALHEVAVDDVVRDCAALFAHPAYAGVLVGAAADPAEDTP
ncbi:insulinase family protein [Streptomyces peucetius]|uniref:Insulinase family protein n=1 Tax=Streptomyces peucetius TaxID=1950 RepID=A0ABY6IAP3_STRPE|nr:insulinase family protein [Streptomyces peucetius]UYQ64028.1 insulinase family protein [Streptomyces peucetius]